MKLILQNGYPSPWPDDLEFTETDRFAEAAGGVALSIEGVIHFQWLHTVTVEFKDRESYDKAQAITGWKPWDGGLVLEASTSPEEGYAHPAIVAAVPYDNHPRTAYCGFMLVED